jgi:HK97 family phage major capsid protein
MSEDTKNGLPLETVQFRHVTLDRALLNERAEGDDRIPVALSSETPVERSFGIEILDHSREGVDLTYAGEGLPLLLDHDPTQQVGIIEDVRLDGGRVRGMARFSRSALAQEIRQDVEDGIRKNMSTGYALLDVMDEQRDGQSKTSSYRFRWRPMEGSLVAIPADITVGVGRAQALAPDTAAAPVEVADTKAPKAETKEERSMSDTPAAPAGVTEVRDNRTEQFTRLAEIAESYGATDKLAGWMRAGTTPETALRELVSEKRQTVQEMSAAKPAGLEGKEERPFSVGRALKALATGNDKEAGYEFAVSSAYAQERGIDTKGVMIPMGVRTTLSVAGSTTGSKAVFTDAGAFIDVLRNASLIRRLGVQTLSGLQGNIALPRQSAAGSAAWYAELFGAADATESNLQIDQVTLSPKTIAATQSYSKQLFAQSVVAIDALVGADIIAVMGLLYDAACFHGTGASNQITGLYSTTNINSVAVGGAVTYAKLVAMEKEIETDNAALASIAYVTTPGVKAVAKTTQRFTSTDTPLWTGGIDGEMNGYAAHASNQILTTLGAGSDHGMVLGAFSQAIVADWGALELVVDPYTKARQGNVNVTGIQFVDFAVRHPEAFCKATTLTGS